MIRVADFIFKHLAAHAAVRHVFMLPGGGCMHLVDALGRNKHFTYVCNLHEQAAAIAAEAYGQYTNDLGVVLVTTGPGSTNAITGVAGAWIDSTPVLVLSGQAKTTDLIGDRGVRQMGIQEVDIVPLVKPITKFAVRVMDPMRIKHVLQKALYLARNGRKGPVWLDIPLDVQGAMVDEDALPEFTPPEEMSSISDENHTSVNEAGWNALPPAWERADVSEANAGRGGGIQAEREMEAQVREFLSILAKSKAPAILSGNGIRLDNAIVAFHAVIDRLQIPVMTSWKAADLLPENHPLYVGRPGIVGQRGANFVQQTCDCLLILGSRLDLCQTGFNHPHFAPRAAKIMVDIDRCEMDKLEMPFALKIASGVGSVLRMMLEKLDAASDALPPTWGRADVSEANAGRGGRQVDGQSPPLPGLAAARLDPPPRGGDGKSTNWLAVCKDWQRRYPVVLPEYCHDEAVPVNTYCLIEVLSEVLGDDAVIVPGSSGACAEITLQAFKVKRGQRMLNTPGLGSMGFGLPASIGACLAAGGRPTVSIIGDGGLQHNIQELETLKRLNLPIKLFILNNGGYGSIYNMQKNRFEGNLVACNPESGLTVPDTCKVAAAYGLQTCRIEHQRGLKDVVSKVLGMRGTVICDVCVDTTVQTAPRLSSRVLPNGQMESMPMEDLWPFLERDEFNAAISATEAICR